MPIPDFQSLMLPLLKLVDNQHEHSMSDLTEALALQFNLSEDERKERLPSGQQAKFDNRVGWARTDLKMAMLIEKTGRGKIRITSRGLTVLDSTPIEINRRFLRQFPEFEAYFSRQENKPDEKGDEPKQTPEETLESSYQSLRRDLAQEILDRIKQCSPRFFEKLVVDLLVSMGYGGSRKDAGEAVGRSGDDGVDGIIKEDKLGLDVVYIQAKRWSGNVGRPVVQAFAGSLEGHRARKGVLITTSNFSQDAKEYVTRIEKKIVLIDGEQLAQLMIDHGVGITEVVTYSVKKIDLDYYDEG